MSGPLSRPTGAKQVHAAARAVKERSIYEKKPQVSKIDVYKITMTMVQKSFV